MTLSEYIYIYILEWVGIQLSLRTPSNRKRLVITLDNWESYKPAKKSQICKNLHICDIWNCLLTPCLVAVLISQNREHRDNLKQIAVHQCKEDIPIKVWEVVATCLLKFSVLLECDVLSIRVCSRSQFFNLLLSRLQHFLYKKIRKTSSSSSSSIVIEYFHHR